MNNTKTGFFNLLDLVKCSSNIININFKPTIHIDIMSISLEHDDIIKWNHFPRYWPFVRGIHRYPVNSLHKGQWLRALMFSWICAWINGWVNNGEAGDFRHHRAHYDVIVMKLLSCGYHRIHWWQTTEICSTVNQSLQHFTSFLSALHGDIRLWNNTATWASWLSETLSDKILSKYISMDAEKPPWELLTHFNPLCDELSWGNKNVFPFT